jgi:SulP family sulfate permease
MPTESTVVLFASFRGYRPAWLAPDLAAGLLLAAIAIPEQIATARLAGMPPVAGLYAFGAGTIAVVLLARNQYLSVGADSTIATIFAVTVSGLVLPGSAQYVLLLGAIAIVTGALLVLAGIAHAEWISDLLSIPVTVGFLAGIAVHIALSQLPGLAGVSFPRPILANFGAFVQTLGHANPLALALGCGVLAIVAAGRLIGEKMPSAVIAFAAAAGAVAVLHLRARVPVVGALRVAPLHLGLPLPANLHAETTLPLAGVLAVVCVLQTVTTLRTYRAHKGIVDVSRDLVATGAGSLVAGVVGSFPVDASPPRTAIVHAAGARSQGAGIAALAAVALFLIFGSQLTAYVPQAALAGVLIYIASRLFQLGEMRRIARERPAEIGLVAASAILVIALPINDGMILSIVLSLFYGVYVMLRPPCVELVHVPDSTIWWPPNETHDGERRAGVVVFSPAAPLYFMNARYVAARLFEAVDRAAGPVRVVVIEGSGVIDIDYTGAHVLRSALRRLVDRGIAVGLARFLDERAMQVAQRAGIVAAVGSNRVFKSADEAVRALEPA